MLVLFSAFLIQRFHLLSLKKFNNIRRPSVGYNVIPHAALCQHRYSLQLNGEGGNGGNSTTQKVHYDFKANLCDNFLNLMFLLTEF